MKEIKRNIILSWIEKTAEDTDRVGSMYCVISVILDIFAGDFVALMILTLKAEQNNLVKK